MTGRGHQHATLRRVRLHGVQVHGVATAGSGRHLLHCSSHHALDVRRGWEGQIERQARQHRVQLRRRQRQAGRNAGIRAVSVGCVHSAHRRFNRNEEKGVTGRPWQGLHRGDAAKTRGNQTAT